MRAAFLTLFLGALLTASATAQQEMSCPPVESAPSICESFSGSLLFSSTEGLFHGQVVMQQWQIPNEMEVKIPHRGFLIVHLRTGALVSEVREERKEWRADSFWSVSAGDPLIVRTARDSVVLQTVDFITQ